MENKNIKYIEIIELNIAASKSDSTIHSKFGMEHLYKLRSIYYICSTPQQYFSKFREHSNLCWRKDYKLRKQ